MIPLTCSHWGRLEVVFVCWVVFVALCSHNNVWVVHINGK